MNVIHGQKAGLEKYCTVCIITVYIETVTEYYIKKYGCVIGGHYYECGQLQPVLFFIVLCVGQAEAEQMEQDPVDRGKVEAVSCLGNQLIKRKGYRDIRDDRNKRCYHCLFQT